MSYRISLILMNISMSGQFSTHITTSVFTGFTVAFPYIFWEFWRFVLPALHDSETNGERDCFFSSLLFLLGVLFDII